MKKYFIKSTGEEITFGDEIELDFIGKEHGKKKICHLECKFAPELVNVLIEGDIVEEKEVQDTIAFDSDYDIDDALDELYEGQENLEKKIEELEQKIDTLMKSKAKK